VDRLWPRTLDQQLKYHTDRNDTPNFEVGQPGRVDLARFFIEKMLLKDLPTRPLRIVELGCGAGDVTGPYSSNMVYETPKGAIDTNGIEVIGIDVVPMAAQTIAPRYPWMKVIVSPVEDLDPIDCDLLVMTEFLEHVDDPIAMTTKWMPHARWALIGHPLNEPNPPFEVGHIWSYTKQDWMEWFYRTNYQWWERMIFPMGHWDEMIMGHGSRID